MADTLKIKTKAEQGGKKSASILKTEMQTQSAASLRRARVKPRVSLARSEIYGAHHLSKLDYKRHICKDTPRLIFIYIKPRNSCGK